MTARYIIIFSTALLLASALPGCKKVPAMNASRAEGISVDGNDADWGDNLIVPEQSNVAFGAGNDDGYLYLVFKTADQETKRMVMFTGLTIWFSAGNKSEKTFGVRYPTGLLMEREGERFGMNEPADEIGERITSRIREMLTEIEVIGPGKDARNRFPRVNPFGISVGISDTSGSMVYELKIPLRAEDNLHYEIATDPGSVIRIGLETGKIDRRALARGMRERRQSGGPEGMGGGRVMRGGGRPQMSRMGDPIEVWMEVKLAESPGSG